MPKLELPWPLDLDGYHISAPARSAGTSRAAKTILGSANVGPSIVRNGGRLDFQDRMEIHALYEQLAECSPTAKGALDFVSRFGFLRAARSETIDFICNEIRVVRSLRKAKRAEKWGRLDLWMIDNRKGIRLNPVLLGGDPPELFFRPSTLIDAIYLQFFEDLSTQANLKLCERAGCRNWFKYGTGTNRRSTAQYCSPKCQNAAKYAKMKEGG